MYHSNKTIIKGELCCHGDILCYLNWMMSDENDRQEWCIAFLTGEINFHRPTAWSGMDFMYLRITCYTNGICIFIYMR